jgi:hypothetical protein
MTWFNFLSLMKESKQRKSRTKSNHFSFLVAQTERLQAKKKAVRSFRSHPPADFVAI